MQGFFGGFSSQIASAEFLFRSSRTELLWVMKSTNKELETSVPGRATWPTGQGRESSEPTPPDPQGSPRASGEEGERRERLYELFDEGLGDASQDREASLREAAADDSELAHEVAHLLQCHENLPTAFLAGDKLAIPPETFPKELGGYRIVGELGRGGMGVVFDAVQDRPQRRVALKVVSGGHLVPELARRFEREARVLGRLKHSGIAQIYEAGTAKVGLESWPFFAMERVDGVGLGEWLSTEPSVAAKLRLFEELCLAVQHAHDRGVVHRDIKPNNVMVVEGVDGTSHPKLLDFGIARILDRDDSSTTLRTQSGQIMGTLAYMSPEQLAGEAGGVDVRADVYSLGVLLFWMLTKRLPLPVEDCPLHEAARIIQRDEPARLAAVVPSLSGDLDTIVQRSLEKSPDRRYASAASLAEDVRRYRSHQPVHARAPSAWYLAAKFARRNRILVGGVSATFLVLVLGLVGTTIALFQVARERDQKEEARRASAAVTTFLADLLSKGDPWTAHSEMTVREAVDRAASTIGTRFRDQPAVEAKLRTTIGRVYEGLSLHQEAILQLQRASAIWKASPAPSPLEPLVTQSGLGTVLYTLGRYDEAQPLLEDALFRIESIVAPDDPRPIATLHSLISLYLATGEEERALALIERGEVRMGGTQDLTRPETAELVDSRATYHRVRGEFREAEVGLRRLYEAAKRGEGGMGVPVFAAVYAGLLGLVNHELGRFDEALEFFKESMDSSDRQLGRLHYISMAIASDYARTLAETGRAQAALQIIDARIQLSQETPNPTGKARVIPKYVRWARGKVLAKLDGRLDEAEKTLREVLAENQAEKGPAASNTRKAHLALLEVLIAQKNYAEARREADLLIEALERKFTSEVPQLRQARSLKLTAETGLARSMNQPR